MKKLLALSLLVALLVALYRRVTASHVPARHLHGTPDSWPPVVRKPGTDRAAAA